MRSLVEEHVLGAAEPDAFGAELARRARIGRRVGVGAHPHVAGGVGPVEELGEGAVELGRDHRRGAGDHLAAGAVEGDEGALADDAAVGARQRAGLGIDAEGVRADDAGEPEAAGDHRRVARHAAPDGQDAVGGVHAADVLGAGLDADEDRRLALGSAGLRGFGGEDDVAGGGAGAGGDAGAEDVARGERVDLRVEVLDQAARLDAQQRLAAGDDARLGEVDGDADGGAGVAPGGLGVEDGDPALLEHEIELAGVAEAGGGALGERAELGEEVGGDLLQRGAATALGEGQRPGVGGCGSGRKLLAPRHKIPGHLGGAGLGGDELQVAGAAGARGEADGEALDDQAEAGVLGGAAGLAQDARRAGVPGAGHGAGGGLELLGRVLRPGLAGLVLEQRPDVGEERAEARRIGLGAAEVAAHQRLDVLRIEAVDGLAEAGDRAHVEAQRRDLAEPGLQQFQRVVAGSDVEHRARAAPGALFRAAAQREEAAVGDAGRQAGHRAAGGEGRDAVEGERQPRRNRQAEGGEAGEIGGAAAVGFDAHGFARIETDDGVERCCDDLLRFHCTAA